MLSCACVLAGAALADLSRVFQWIIAEVLIEEVQKLLKAGKTWDQISSMPMSYWRNTGGVVVPPPELLTAEFVAWGDFWRDKIDVKGVRLFDDRFQGVFKHNLERCVRAGRFSGKC